MALLKRHPFLFFFLFVLAFGLAEAILTPILSFTADEGLAITVPLGYLAEVLAVIAPFLTVGAMAYAVCEGGFSRALPFFAVFLGVKVFVCFPVSIIEYSEALSSPFPLVLGVYLLSAVLESGIILLLLWIGTLLLARSERTHEEVFFGTHGTDARILLFAVAVIALEDILTFAFSFVDHLKSKLWIFDAGDLADIFISLAVIALCAFLSFASGRFASKLLTEES